MKMKLKIKVETFINNQEKIYEYNLSEILFDLNTDYKELIDFINKLWF